MSEPNALYRYLIKEFASEPSRGVSVGNLRDNTLNVPRLAEILCARKFGGTLHTDVNKKGSDFTLPNMKLAEVKCWSTFVSAGMESCAVKNLDTKKKSQLIIILHSTVHDIVYMLNLSPRTWVKYIEPHNKGQISFRFTKMSTPWWFKHATIVEPNAAGTSKYPVSRPA